MMQVCVISLLFMQNPESSFFSEELLQRGFEKFPHNISRIELAPTYTFLKKTATIDLIPEGINWFIFKPKKDDDYNFSWMKEAGKKNNIKVGLILLPPHIRSLQKSAEMNFAFLAEIEGLVYLKINTLGETGKRVAELSKIKGLLFLDITASGDVSDNDFKGLGNLPNLRLLSIFCYGHRASGENNTFDMTFVNALKNLGYFRLHGANYDVGKIQFEKLRKLEYLHLENGNNGWEIVEKLKGAKIKHLSFSTDMWPDDFFEILNNNFPTLRGLTLATNGLQKLPLIQKGYFENLVYLDLSGAVEYYPNDKELERLEFINNLEFLDIAFAKINKNTFEKIGTLKKLKMLILSKASFDRELIKENDLQSSELWKNCKIVIRP